MPEDYGITVGKFTVRDKRPFAAEIKENTLSYFSGSRKTPSMTVICSADAPVEMRVETWPDDGNGARKWSESCRQAKVGVRHTIFDLPPNQAWKLYCNEPSWSLCEAMSTAGWFSLLRGTSRRRRPSNFALQGHNIGGRPVIRSVMGGGRKTA